MHLNIYLMLICDIDASTGVIVSLGLPIPKWALGSLIRHYA